MINHYRMVKKQRLGDLPAGSSVAIQQDPYSATILTNLETAENILNDRVGTKSGGRRTRRRRRNHRRTKRTKRNNK